MLDPSVYHLGPKNNNKVASRFRLMLMLVAIAVDLLLGMGSIVTNTTYRVVLTLRLLIRLGLRGSTSLSCRREEGRRKNWKNGGRVCL